MIDKQTRLISFIFLLLILLLVAYYFLSNRNQTESRRQPATLPATTPAQIESNSPAPNQFEPTVTDYISPTMKPDDKLAPTLTNDKPPSPTPLEEGWKTYRSGEHQFVVQHPSDIQIKESNLEGVVFLKMGPTQGENTELYDGFRLAFNLEEKEKELKKVVEEEHERELSSPTTDSATQIKQATVNKYQGYEFTVSHVYGKTRNIFLNAGDETYFTIEESIYDPDEQDYRQIVDQIEQSLQLQSVQIQI